MSSSKGIPPTYNMLMHLQPRWQYHANPCHHLCCVTPDTMGEYSSPAAPWSPPDDDLLPPLVAMDSSVGARLLVAPALSAGATLLAAPCYCKPCNCDVPVSWLTPVIQPEIAILRYVAATSSDVHASLMSPPSALDVFGDDTMDDVSPLADEMVPLDHRNVSGSPLLHCLQLAQ